MPDPNEIGDLKLRLKELQSSGAADKNPLVAADDMMRQGVSPPPGYNPIAVPTGIKPEAQQRAETWLREQLQEAFPEHAGGNREVLVQRIVVKMGEFMRPVVEDQHRGREVARLRALMDAQSDEDIAREYWEGGWESECPCPWSALRSDVQKAIRGQVKGVREAMRRRGIA